MKIEEIKVGEYVRTTLGISRLLKIKDSVLYFDELNDELWSGDLANVMYKCFADDEIIKHSNNIIDLIEVGDYVNGEIVRATYLEGVNHYIKLGKEITGKRTYNKDIKSIVTKEAFASVEYKL